MKNDRPRTQLDFEALDKLMSSAGNAAMFCHINPDGDCIGAMLALSRAFKLRFGSTPTLFSHDGVPLFLRFMLKPDEKFHDSSDIEAMKSRTFDSAILLDTATKKRAGEAFFPFLDNAAVTVCIDHHVTNGHFAAHNFVDGDASSACEVLFHFFKARGWEITQDIAECLYLGIMYDTGRFMHANTTPEVFSICGELVDAGADPSNIAGHVYKDRSPSSLRLLGHALNNMKTAGDGRIAWAAVPRSVFRELGATDTDTEGIVEALGAYHGCEVHVFFCEGPDGLSRVSSRSAGRVKVNEICMMFGGGGHDFAAGIRTSKPLEEIERLFIEEAEKRLG